MKVFKRLKLMSESKVLYRRAFEFVIPYKDLCLYAVMCSLGVAACELCFPTVVGKIFEKILAEKDITKLKEIVLLVVFAFFGRGIFRWGQKRLMNDIAQNVVVDIRTALVAKINRRGMSYFDKNQTGSIMSLVTNDANVLQNTLTGDMLSLITGIATVVGTVAAMIRVNRVLSLWVIMVFVPVFILYKLFGKKIQESGNRIQESSADLNAMLQEIVSSASIVKSFGREKYEAELFHLKNLRNFRENFKNAQYRSIKDPLVEFILACALAIVLWHGGLLVIEGTIKSGEIVTFIAFAANAIRPVKNVSEVMGNIQKATPAAQRIFDFLDADEEITDKANAVDLIDNITEIEFKNVTFAYNEEEDVLKNFSFKAKMGQVIAFVGPSGAGKSTIAKLLPRFYDVKDGTITINGTDIRNVKVKNLRDSIGIVPQESPLFNRSVRDNILYGRLDASEEEIKEAANDANATEFINELPGKYDNILGERGYTLSGGQRQRIAIARAILKNPQILILDEATSALDPKSEREVQEALNRLMVGRTTFVIAHRLSTIKDADQILVMNKGELVEKGTHKELLEIDGLYAKLWGIQQNSNSGENSLEV